MREGSSVENCEETFKVPLLASVLVALRRDGARLPTLAFKRLKSEGAFEEEEDFEEDLDLDLLGRILTLTYRVN